MMAASKPIPLLIERLPKARGSYRADAPMARISWLKVGGSAEVMFKPVDVLDLANFLAAKPDDVPVVIIGGASNLLVRDGGIPGVVIRLGRNFAGIDVKGSELQVGAGALDINVAAAALNASIAGLEFLSGIPGTIGGALRMNAGAFGAEMKDCVVKAQALDAKGNAHELGPDELGFCYRGCSVPKDWIFIAATLQGRQEARESIARRMDEIAARRKDAQPNREQSAGCAFANPPGMKAWELIERAGCRGLTSGGAKISEKHCNFLVNANHATAADLEGLGEEVRRLVHEATGVRLEWEIQRIGVALPRQLKEIKS